MAILLKWKSEVKRISNKQKYYKRNLMFKQSRRIDLGPILFKEKY